MKEYGFSKFPDVDLINVDCDQLNEEQKQLLYTQAQYSQAMVDKDIDVLRALTSPGKTFTHMSGKEQTREEFFNDIKNDQLQYFSIGIRDPLITINDQLGSIEFTSILDAKAYGSKGIFPMKVIHHYERQNDKWININKPDK